jgi:hypothetical protein
MKKVGCFIVLIMCVMLSLGQYNAAESYAFSRVFDEYGPICWEDEKARLDNFSIALLYGDKTSIGNIIVYDGKSACRGEAVARAIRAKKYLVEFRKVEPDRVIWRWGGHREELTTILQDMPLGSGTWPLMPLTSPDEVIFIGNCKGKVRRVKCYR